MAEEIQRLINIDSSVLIEYFRKSEKTNAFFVKLLNKFQGFYVSVAVHFEIYQDIQGLQLSFWDNLFQDFLVVPYTENINSYSIDIHRELKRKRKSIEFKDLMIAATAKANKLPLATLNKKHFYNIEGLDLITPDDL